MTKGFITLAIGDHYYKLAAHLYMSYRLFANCEYPFYVLTDREGQEKLKGLFDGFIIKDDFKRTTEDKIKIFADTPFDETIFIDADSSIVGDLTSLFEAFEKNGSDLSAISDIRSLQEGESGIQFNQTAIQMFHLAYDFPNFNGGVYYYQKSDLGKECIRFMTEELLPHYHAYGLFTDDDFIKIYDEPAVIVTMLKFGMKTIPLSTNVMYPVQKPKKVKWNLRHRRCKFQWYEYIVSPKIIHWKLAGTETYCYEKYDAKVKGQFYHFCIFRVKAMKFLAFVKYHIYAKLSQLFSRRKKAKEDNLEQ